MRILRYYSKESKKRNLENIFLFVPILGEVLYAKNTHPKECLKLSKHVTGGNKCPDRTHFREPKII